MKLPNFDPEADLKRLAKRAKLSPKGLAIQGTVIKPPYIMVQVANKKKLSVGFAKCSPHDTFDENIGLRIATARALRDLSNG